jgi:hypothetical protein
MHLAGFPAQISLAGTFLVTTLPDPIIELLPISIPGSIQAFIPTHTLSPITTGLQNNPSVSSILLLREFWI